jgi:hypothetical protein
VGNLHDAAYTWNSRKELQFGEGSPFNLFFSTHTKSCMSSFPVSDQKKNATIQGTCLLNSELSISATHARRLHACFNRNMQVQCDESNFYDGV